MAVEGSSVQASINQRRRWATHRTKGFKRKKDQAARGWRTPEPDQNDSRAELDWEGRGRAPLWDRQTRLFNYRSFSAREKNLVFPFKCAKEKMMMMMTVWTGAAGCSWSELSRAHRFTITTSGTVRPSSYPSDWLLPRRSDFLDRSI